MQKERISMQGGELLRRELERVQMNVLLKNHTTFQIGGPARYFFVAHTSKDVEKGVQTALELDMPFFLLSGGSNVLMPDSGFAGLVIKVQNTNYTIRNPHALWAEAGVQMDTLVRETGRRGLAGLEWAGGLPGTLGGAVRGNAGAFGGEIKDSVIQVEALDGKGRRRIFYQHECLFGYRTSLFKQKGYVVLAATLQLRKGNQKGIEKVARDHIRYRRERHPLEHPNAGSIFKNCDVTNVPQRVRKEFASVVKIDPFPLIPAAALIAAANLQGFRVGGAEISRKHPNYIVNLGNACAKDVITLIEKVKKSIRKKFEVDLEEEITIL